MPQWTLGQLMSQATTRIGRRSDIPPSTVSFWANQAIEDVALEAPQSSLESITAFSTVSGTSRYSLPANMYELLSLSYTSQAQVSSSALTLRRMDERNADAMYGGNGAQPTHFVMYANWCELWPSPNSAYSMQFRSRLYPSELTLTSATPSLDTEWRPLALLRLEQYLHEHLGNDDSAAVAAARFLQRVSTLKDSIAKRQSPRDMRASLGIVGRRSRRLGSSWPSHDTDDD